MKTEIDFKTAEQAFRGTSFSSERRAQQVITEFKAMMEVDKKKILSYFSDDVEGYDTYIDHHNYCSLNYSRWLIARSKCISTMIAGPSNFPVNRAKKANRSSQGAYEKFSAGREKSLKRAWKKAYPMGDGSLIMARDPDLVEKLKTKIAGLLLEKKNLKLLKIYLKSPEKYTDKIKELKFSRAEVLSYIRDGIPSFKINSINQRIKAAQDRLSKIEAQKALEVLEYQFDGGRVIVNPEIMRVQLIYSDKPEPETRTKLKSNGFKYSRKYNAWQRIFNNRAVYVCETLLGLSMQAAYI